MKQSIMLGICAGVLTCTLNFVQPNISMASQSEEMTVATVDIHSIPEEYRTVDNFGPAFENGIPADKVSDIDLVINVENTNEEVVESTTIPVIEPIIIAEVGSVSRVIEVGVGSVVEATVESDQDIQVNIPSNRWGIVLNEEEINALAKVLWKEARGESDEGEQAVVEVVFNRVYSDNYPNTCIGVLSQRRQFSTWPGRDSARPTEREYRNIQVVLDGGSNILPYQTVFFSTKPQNNRIQLHLGGHYFCNQR